jgi:hypothetical protein
MLRQLGDIIILRPKPLDRKTLNMAGIGDLLCLLILYFLSHAEILHRRRSSNTNKEEKRCSFLV